MLVTIASVPRPRLYQQKLTHHMLLCEFLPFLVGLLSGILGGLIGAAIWRKKLQPLRDELDVCRKKTEDINLNLTRQKNKFADLQRDHRQLSDSAANWEHKYGLLEKETTALRTAKEGLERKYKEARRGDDAELLHLRQQNASLTEQLAEHDAEINALQAQLTNSRFEKTQAQENLAAAKSQVDRSAKGDSANVKQLRSDMEQLRRKAGASAALVKQLETEKAQLTAKVVELEGDLAGFTPAAAGTGEWAAEKAALEARIKELEAQLAAPAPRGLTTEVAAPEAQPTTETVAEEATPPAPAAGTLIVLPSGAKVKQDDLKMVEGIGPKIEGLLHAAGIKTWRQLADAPVDEVQKVLDEAGPRYRMHQPTTWAKQALLAADGKWEELEAYQDRLVGGREPEE
jgi:predicted flap endonuclease-1-like 5' DNA nuclease/predicted  nucleic acid-binding Zn-ribbon protein